MPREFELRKEITLDATPEQVWEAIATGQGIDAWFMGLNQVEPREGGRTAMTIAGHTEEGVVTAWEPPPPLRLPRREPRRRPVHGLRVADRGPRRRHLRAPAGPERRPRRRLGDRVRRPHQGLGHVPAPARPVPRALPRPARRPGHGHAPGGGRRRPRLVGALGRPGADAARPPRGTRCASPPRAWTRSRAWSTGSPRRPSACAATTGCTVSSAATTARSSPGTTSSPATWTQRRPSGPGSLAHPAVRDELRRRGGQIQMTEPTPRPATAATPR